MLVSLSVDLLCSSLGCPPDRLHEIRSLDLHFDRRRGAEGHRLRSVDDLGRICPQLEVVNLSYHAITHLSGVDRLVMLKELNLADNDLQEIDSIGNLTNLERLNLSGNQLLRLPPSIRRLQRLSHLRLARNALQEIRDFEQLRHLPRLTNLRVDDNPCIRSFAAQVSGNGVSGLSRESIINSFVSSLGSRLANQIRHPAAFLFILLQVPSLEALDGVEVQYIWRLNAIDCFADSEAAALLCRIRVEQNRLQKLRNEALKAQQESVTAKLSFGDRELMASRAADRLEEARTVEAEIQRLQEALREAEDKDAPLSPMYASVLASPPPTLFPTSPVALSQAANEPSNGLMASRKIDDLNTRVERLAAKVLSAEQEKAALRNELRASSSAARELMATRDDLVVSESSLETAIEAAQAAEAHVCRLSEELAVAKALVKAKNAVLEEKDSEIAVLRDTLREAEKERDELLPLRDLIRLGVTGGGSAAAAGLSVTETYRAQEARMALLSQNLDVRELQTANQDLAAAVDRTKAENSRLNMRISDMSEELERLTTALNRHKELVHEKDTALGSQESEIRKLQRALQDAQVLNEQTERERDEQFMRAEQISADLAALVRAKEKAPIVASATEMADSLPWNKVSHKAGYFDDLNQSSSQSTGGRSIPRFQVSELERSAAEIVASVMLEEIRASTIPSFTTDGKNNTINNGTETAAVLAEVANSRIGAELREACIRAALRLVATSVQLNRSDVKGATTPRNAAAISPFHALGDRDALSRLVAETHSGLAALDDAVLLRQEATALTKAIGELEARVRITETRLADREATLKSLEVHAQEARQQAEAALSTTESASLKLVTCREELVRSESELTACRRELSNVRNTLKEHTELSAAEQRSLSETRDRLVQLRSEEAQAAASLAASREAVATEERRLREVKSSAAESLRQLQAEVAAVQRDFRGRQAGINEAMALQRQAEEEASVRKRDAEASLTLITREAEAMSRRVSAARNELSVTRLEIEQLASRKRAAESELSSVNESLASATAAAAVEEAEQRRRYEVAEKAAYAAESRLNELRSAVSTLEAEKSSLRLNIEELRRQANDAEKALETRRRVSQEELATTQAAITNAMRTLRERSSAAEARTLDVESATAAARLAERRLEELRRMVREAESSLEAARDTTRIQEQEREKLARDCTTLRGDEEAKKANIATLRAAIESETRQLDEIRRRLVTATDEEAALRDSETRARASLATLRASHDELNGELTSLQGQVDRERRILAELTSRRATSEGEVKRLAAEVQAWEERRQSTSSQAVSSETTALRVTEEVSRLRAATVQYESRLSEAASREEAMKSSERVLRAQMARLVVELDGLRSLQVAESAAASAATASATEQRLAMTREREELESVRSELQREKTALMSSQQALDLLHSQYDSVTRELANVREANRQEKTRTAALEAAYERLETRICRLRDAFESAQQAYESARQRAEGASRLADTTESAVATAVTELRRLTGEIEVARETARDERTAAMRELALLSEARTVASKVHDRREISPPPTAPPVSPRRGRQMPSPTPRPAPAVCSILQRRSSTSPTPHIPPGTSRLVTRYGEEKNRSSSSPSPPPHESLFLRDRVASHGAADAEDDSISGESRSVESLAEKTRRLRELSSAALNTARSA